MYIERNLRSLTGIPRRRVRSNGSETIKQSLVKWMICKNVRYYLFHFSLFALKLKVSPERLEVGRGEVGGICVSRYYTLHYCPALWVTAAGHGTSGKVLSFILLTLSQICTGMLQSLL